MNTLRLSTSRLVIAVLTVSVALAACSARPQPTSAPKLQPTVAVKKPTQPPQPTAAPTTAPRSTPIPTTVPTAVSQSTRGSVTPIHTPAAQPTAAPQVLGFERSMGDLLINPIRSEQQASSGANKPKTGNAYLFVTVTIENTSKTDSITFDPASFSLVALNGGLTFSPISLTSLTTELNVTKLKPGERIEGLIPFEIPQKNSGFDLMLKSNTDGPNYLWSIAG